MAEKKVLPCLPAALAKDLAVQYLGLSVSTFEKLVREGVMPPPRRLSARRVAWVRAELDEWLLRQPVSDLLPPENTGALKPRPSDKS